MLCRTFLGRLSLINGISLGIMTTLLEASPLHFKFNGPDRLNPHLGAVVWPDKADTLAQGLAFVNSAGNAVVKVDNKTNVLYPNKRNSVRKTHIIRTCVCCTK